LRKKKKKKQLKEHRATFQHFFSKCPQVVSDSLLFRSRQLELFISFIQERIEAEQIFVRHLQKLAQKSLEIDEGRTLAEGFIKLKSDVNNECADRMAFCENLMEVGAELSEFQSSYFEKVKRISDEITQKVKKFQNIYKQWLKTKEKYHRACEQASNAKHLLLQNGSTLTKSQAVKLGKKVHSASNNQQSWEKKFELEGTAYRKASTDTALLVNSSLDVYYTLENERIQFLKDILRKLLVYGTNMLRSRQYDINNVAAFFENIDSDGDLIDIMNRLEGDRHHPSYELPPTPISIPESPVVAISPGPSMVPQAGLRDVFSMEQLIWVLSKSGIWRQASIKEKTPTELKIHYKGFHKKYDEYLPYESNRISIQQPSEEELEKSRKQIERRKKARELKMEKEELTLDMGSKDEDVKRSEFENM